MTALLVGGFLLGVGVTHAAPEAPEVLAPSSAAPRWVASLAADAAVVAQARAAGGSGMVGVLLTPRWSLEGAAMLHVAGGDAGIQPLWGVQLDTRWRPLPERRGPSVVVGGGVEQRALVTTAGLALDVSPRVRVQASYRLRPLAEATSTLAPQATTLSLGWTFPEPGQPASPPPLPPPEVALTWLPHPVCDWVPVDTVEDLLATFPPEVRAQILAEQAATQMPAPGASVEAVAPPEETPLPLQGAVIIVAGVGDRVTLSTPGGADVPIPLGADGAAVATVPEGPFSVTVAGGGRTQVREGGVFDGHGTWVVVPPPDRITVYFAGGSSVLTPEAAQVLAPIAVLPGGWHYEVRGEASAEGAAEINQRLSRERAEVTAAALIAAGVPAAQVIVRDAVIGDQRAAYVLPVPP